MRSRGSPGGRASSSRAISELTGSRRSETHPPLPVPLQLLLIPQAPGARSARLPGTWCGAQRVAPVRWSRHDVQEQAGHNRRRQDERALLVLAAAAVSMRAVAAAIEEGGCAPLPNPTLIPLCPTLSHFPSHFAARIPRNPAESRRFRGPSVLCPVSRDNPTSGPVQRPRRGGARSCANPVDRMTPPVRPLQFSQVGRRASLLPQRCRPD